ncbi:MAG: hypothetical protein R8G66_01790 [Cytophagales bacterium]|nr:hypothetical protein [Cytophagales bacterium]
MSTFPITFTINTDTIITAYNTHNGKIKGNEKPYGQDNRMPITPSYYTSDPVPSGSPLAIDIDAHTCIEISFVDSAQNPNNSIYFQKFEDVQGDLISDTTNPNHDASLAMPVTLPVTGTAYETFDILFQIEVQDSSNVSEIYYCELDPKLKANQGHN